MFAVLMIAYLAFGVGLVVQARQAASGDYTTIAYSHPALWLPISGVMVSGVVLSVASARAARNSWKVTATFVHEA